MHIARGFDPYIFNDDARQQIYPLFRYADSSLFPNDYIADYYLACLPLGFRALYALSAPLLDPAVSSKAVTYLMLLLTVTGLGAAANKLGGKAAAWGAMALTLGASLYLDRMGGGLPRAFAFPILAWALVALSYGRMKWLAVLVWLGAAFYPVAGVVVGLSAALVVLALPACDRGDARDWGLRRRIGYLAVVVAVSGALLLPTVVTSSKYGPVLTADDVTQYPEAGPGGRYAPNSRAPFDSFFQNAETAIARGFIGVGRPWIGPVYRWVNAGESPRAASNPRSAILKIIAMFTAMGWVLFAASSCAARRVLLLGLAALVGYSIAFSVAPYFYLPTRYTNYPMPLLAALMASTAVAGFSSLSEKLGSKSTGPAAQRASSERPFQVVLTFVFCGFMLITVGGRGSHTAGLNVDTTRDAPLYDTIARLPVDAVIAGWPGTAIENVPYVSRRTAFVTLETHQAFHQQYVDVMRKRMRALIDASLATSTEPLIRLRDAYGVTHMLVYLPHLRGAPFKYFRPFNRWIADAQRKRGGKPLLLNELVDQGGAYRRGAYAIIDLREVRRLR